MLLSRSLSFAVTLGTRACKIEQYWMAQLKFAFAQARSA